MSTRKDNHPFFIVGSARSGTTLLVRLLNQHRNLFIPPETAFFYALAEFKKSGKETGGKEALEKFVKVYQHWRTIQFLGIDSDQFGAVLLCDAENYTDVFCNLMNYLALKSGKQHWGDKTPHHLPYVLDISENMKDAKFICLLRDGRAVVKSRINHPKWNDTLLSAARKWGADVRIIQKLQKELKMEDFLLVRFEDLLCTPQPVLQNIFNFLGEDEGNIELGSQPDSQFPEFYAQSWMKKSTSTIDSSRAKAWKQEYSTHDLKLVEACIGNELEIMNYSKCSADVSFWQIAYMKLYCHDFTQRVVNKVQRVIRRNYEWGQDL